MKLNEADLRDIFNDCVVIANELYGEAAGLDHPNGFRFEYELSDELLVVWIRWEGSVCLHLQSTRTKIIDLWTGEYGPWVEALADARRTIES